MHPFFRSFFAALLALIVFNLIFFVMMIIVVVALSSKTEVETGDKAVMVLDLSTRYPEIEPADPLAKLMGDEESVAPSLFHLVSLINHASTDASVKGIFVKSENNANDFAASEEIRKALLNFKSKGKFVVASANNISQKAYFVASVSDKIYCAPTGGIEWHGFSMTMPFLKGTLEKLEIEPQIFYAGKFKSATEPFRETQMTEANRLQTKELLSDLYTHFLFQIGNARKIDTAQLRRFADSNMVQFASNALSTKMVDGLKFDDEVKDEIRQRLKIEKDKSINFITPEKYRQAVEYLPSGGSKIAVIFAEGTIIDGKSQRDQIGGETYRNLIRKARTDESIKAMVIRINSGGGSATASEEMWREVELAKKVKPVIVSFGDVAASGGYYMACAADSIFAEANTITGSIGVFGILPNMEKFFNNKLGVTFDDVKTSPDANLLTVTKPLTPSQKLYFQRMIDTTYQIFKYRVSEGRGRSMEYVDSIAQGRVWSGTRALQLGLVDRIGSLNDAIAAAAAKAKVKDYRVREFPDKPGFLELIKGKTEGSKETMIREELGEETYNAVNTIRQLRQMIGNVQARIPFEPIVD